MYPDEELLALSGIQHFSFCRRQWALIHIGQRWQENYLTASGQVAHQRAHDDEVRCEVRESAAEMHQLFKRGSIPKARKGKACRACSLIDECLPVLQPRSALSYINSTLGECDASSSKKNTSGSDAS